MSNSTDLLRTSERTSFAWCRQQWQWGYVEGWRSKPEFERSYFTFGDLIHQALEGWYIPGRERGEHPRITFKKLYRKYDKEFNLKDNDSKEWKNADKMGVALLNGYVDHYGDEPHIEVIAPEMTFEVTIESKQGKPMRSYVMRGDCVYRDLSKRGRISLFEHKTTNKSAGQGDHLVLDEQASTYWAFAPEVLRKLGYLDEDESIDIINYNFIRKAMPDTRPQNAKGQRLNKDGTVSKQQPAPYFERFPVVREEFQREAQLKLIRQQIYEMDLVHKGKLPVYKSKSFMCPRVCQFFDACVLHEHGADWEEYLKMTMVQGDPYQDYKERGVLLR